MARYKPRGYVKVAAPQKRGLEEGATHIGLLDPQNPTPEDSIRQGDDHIRLVKQTLLNTFPRLIDTTDNLPFTRHIFNAIAPKFGDLRMSSLPIDGANYEKQEGWVLCDGQRWDSVLTRYDANGNPEYANGVNVPNFVDKFARGGNGSNELSTGGRDDAHVLEHTHFNEWSTTTGIQSAQPKLQQRYLDVDEGAEDVSYNIPVPPLSHTEGVAFNDGGVYWTDAGNEPPEFFGGPILTPQHNDVYRITGDHTHSVSNDEDTQGVVEPQGEVITNMPAFNTANILVYVGPEAVPVT